VTHHTSNTFAVRIKDTTPDENHDHCKEIVKLIKHKAHKKHIHLTASACHLDNLGIALAVSLDKQPVDRQAAIFTNALKKSFGGKLQFDFANVCTIPDTGKWFFFFRNVYLNPLMSVSPLGVQQNDVGFTLDREQLEPHLRKVFIGVALSASVSSYRHL